MHGSYVEGIVGFRAIWRIGITVVDVFSDPGGDVQHESKPCNPVGTVNRKIVAAQTKRKLDGTETRCMGRGIDMIPRRIWKKGFFDVRQVVATLFASLFEGASDAAG